jgi:hypothetical protein
VWGRKTCPARARLQILWDSYNDTFNTNPDLVERLHVHSFEEDIHHLLLRYKDGAAVHLQCTLSAHWENESGGQHEKPLGHPSSNYGVPAAAPPHHLGEVGQSTELPPCHADLIDSCRERNQVFGATWNAFSVKWCRSEALNMNTRVRLHVILLGVGGTIHSSMHTTLKQIGLKPRATANVAGKLHKHATVYARRITQTKWSQEFVLKRDTG